MNNEEMSIKLAEIEQRCKSNTHRIDKLERNTEALNRLTTAVEVMATKQDHIADAVDALDGKVTALECKPAKRWDSLVDKVIWAVAGGVIVYLLAQIGL